MKKGQFIDSRASRAGIFDSAAKPGVGQLDLKSLVPVETEWVFVAKSVAGERVTFENVNRFFPGVVQALCRAPICYWRSIPDNAACFF